MKRGNFKGGLEHLKARLKSAWNVCQLKWSATDKGRQLVRHILNPIYSVIFIADLIFLGQYELLGFVLATCYAVPVLLLIIEFSPKKLGKWWCRILLFPLFAIGYSFNEFKKPNDADNNNRGDGEEEANVLVEQESAPPPQQHHHHHQEQRQQQQQQQQQQQHQQEQWQQQQLQQQPQEQRQQQQQQQEEQQQQYEHPQQAPPRKVIPDGKERFILLVKAVRSNLGSAIELGISQYLIQRGLVALPSQVETKWDNGFGTEINFGSGITIMVMVVSLWSIIWKIGTKIKVFSYFEKAIIVFPSAMFRILSVVFVVSYLASFSFIPIGLLVLVQLFFAFKCSKSWKEKTNSFFLSWILPLPKKLSSGGAAVRKQFLLFEIVAGNIILLVTTAVTYTLVVATDYLYDPNIIISHEKFKLSLILLCIIGGISTLGSLFTYAYMRCESDVRARGLIDISKAIATAIVYIAIIYVVVSITLVPSKSIYLVSKNSNIRDTYVLRTRQANSVRPEDCSSNNSTSANVVHTCSKIQEINGTIFIYDENTRHHHPGSDCSNGLDSILYLLKQHDIKPMALMVVSSLYRPSSPPQAKFEDFDFPISIVRAADAPLAHSIRGQAEVMIADEVKATYGNSDCINCLYNDEDCSGLLQSKSCMTTGDYLFQQRKMIQEKEDDHSTLCPYNNDLCKKFNNTINEIDKGLNIFKSHVQKLEEDNGSNSSKKKSARRLFIMYLNSPFSPEMIDNFINDTSYHLGQLQRNTGVLTDRSLNFTTARNEDMRFPWLKLSIPFDTTYHECVKDWNRGDNNTCSSSSLYDPPNLNMELIQEFVQHSHELDRFGLDTHFVKFYPRDQTNVETSVQYCELTGACNEVSLLPPIEVKTNSRARIVNIQESTVQNFHNMEVLIETINGWQMIDHQELLSSFKCNQEGLLRFRYRLLDNMGSSVTGISFSSWTMMMDADNATCTSATMGTKHFSCEQTCHSENSYGFRVASDWLLVKDVAWVSNIGDQVFCNPGSGSYTCKQHPTGSGGYCQLNCDPGMVPSGITMAMVSDPEAMRSLATSSCMVPKALVFFKDHVEEVTSRGRVQKWHGEHLPAGLVKKQPFWVQGVLRLCGYLTSDLSFKRPVCYQYFPEWNEWRQAFAPSQDIHLEFASRPVAGFDTHYAPINKPVAKGGWEVDWLEFSPISHFWQWSKGLRSLCGKAHGCLMDIGLGKLLITVEDNGTNVFGVVDTGLQTVEESDAFPDHLQDLDILLCSYLDKNTIGFLAKNMTGEMVLIEVTDYESKERQFPVHELGVTEDIVAMELVGEKVFLYGSSQLYNLKRSGRSWGANRLKVTYLQQEAEAVVLVPQDL